MTFRTDWLDRVALYHPGRTALVWEPTGAAYTYAQCDALAERLAAGLAHTYGIAPGDRVAILAENTAEQGLMLKGFMTPERICAADSAQIALQTAMNFAAWDARHAWIVEERSAVKAAPDFVDYCAANAAATLIPDAGHLVMLEQPAAFNARVLAFLQDS